MSIGQVRCGAGLVCATCLGVLPIAWSDDFELTWQDVNGGSATLSGGDFEMRASVGPTQSAEPLTGGDIELTPGETILDPLPLLFGDADSDGDVDLPDLSRLLSNYGETSGALWWDGDFDDDGDVDLSDLARLLANFGLQQ